MDEYKISLGVKLDTSDIQNQVNAASNNIKPLELKIDAETKELTKTIKEALNSLSKGTEGVLKIDTSKIETSLDKLSGVIEDIRNSLGTLDSKSGMKNLLSSINQIATALGKVENESDSLVKSLSALSKKDFSINFGFNMGKSISEQGDIKRDAISRLKKQAEALGDYLNSYYKVTQEYEGVVKLAQGTKEIRTFFEISQNINNPKANLKDQVSAYKKLVDLIHEAAKIKGIDLSGVTSGFSETTDDIVKGTKSATNNVEELKQQFKGLFGSSIDGEKLSAQLDDITTNLKEIKTVIQGLTQNNAIDGLTQSFNKLSDTLDKLMTNAKLVQDVLSGVSSSTNTGVGGRLEQQAQQAQQSAQEIQQAAKQTTDAYNQMSQGASTLSHLDSLNLKDDIDEADRLTAALSKLKNIQTNIKKIDIGNVDTSKGIQELQTLENHLESLSAEYNATIAEINSKGGVSATQFQSIQNEIDNTELQLEQLKVKLREDIKLKINTDIAKNIQKVNSDAKKLSVTTTELQQKLDLLDSIKVDLDTAAANNDIEGLKKGYQDYLRVLKDVKTQIDINKQAERDAAASAKLEDDRILFHNKIDSWLAKNSAAAKQFGGRLREMQAEVKNCDRQTLNRLEAELKQIDKAAEGAGKKTKTFGDSLKTQFAKYSSYFSVASLFIYAEQGLRSMFEQVKLIDSAMTELKKVTNETDATYEKFLTNAASRAREIGTTIDGLVSSTADFARLGYGFEDAQGLAEVANIYAVVGDEIDGVEGATESLISTMAAFKDEMNGMSNTDFAMSIIDKFNEIGNNFAISSGGIGEALERSASSLMAANNTIDESIALITAANTVVGFVPPSIVIY